MRKIIAIFIKDLKLRFSSPIEWLFFLILPVIFIFVLSGGTGNPEDVRINLFTVDQANSSLSRRLLDELENSAAIRPSVVSLEEGIELFNARQVSALLIIPSNFTEESLLSGTAQVELKQQQNNLNALVHQQVVQAAARKLGSLLDIASLGVAEAEAILPFASSADRDAFYQDTLDQAQGMVSTAPVRLTEVQAGTADPVEYDPRANSTAGQMITWVFIPLIGLSASLAYERARGTLRRLMVTPTSRGLFLGSTILGQVVLAIVQMSVLILFGALVMGVNWGREPFALALVMISAALAAAALGMMLGTFIKSEAQGNGLATMTGMVMAMMGGCWYPIELFPPAIRSAAQVLPTFWAMRGFLDIAVRGQGISGVALESAVLLAFALVFFIIGILRFRFE